VLVDEVNTLRGIQIHGTAKIDHDSIYEKAPTVLETSRNVSGMSKEKLKRIAKAYVDAFRLVILRITPRKIESFDYGKYEAWSNWRKTLSSIKREKQA
jgi:hypothetical protein